MRAALEYSIFAWLLLASVWLPKALRASLEPFIQLPCRLPCQVARCRYDRRSRVTRRLL